MIVIDPKTIPPAVMIDGVAYAPIVEPSAPPPPDDDPPATTVPAVPADPPPPVDVVAARPGHLPMLRSGQRVLVPSGEYAISLDLSGLRDVTIQWDGRGQRPRLTRLNGAGQLVRFDAASANITFDGLDIDAGAAVAFHLAGRQLTFRNLRFVSCANAFLAEESVDGVVIEACQVIGDTALSGYFLWAGGGGSTVRNVTVRTCTVPNSTRQHIVRLRFGAIRDILFEGCDFANIDRRKIDGQDIANHTFFIQQGSGIILRNCKLRDGSLALGPLGGDDGANDTNAKTAHVSNVLVEGCELFNTTLEVYAGCSDITARHCTIHVDYHDPNAGLGACVNVAGRDKSHGWDRRVENVLIDSCTGISNSRTARFLSIRGAVEGLRLLKSTFIAPNMVCGGYGSSIISSPDPKYIAESTNNTWPDAKTDGWAKGGLFNLGPDGTGTGHGFWSKAQWLALGQVRGDQFKVMAVDNWGVNPIE